MILPYFSLLSAPLLYRHLKSADARLGLVKFW